MKVKIKIKMKRVLVTIVVYSSVMCGLQIICRTTVYVSGCSDSKVEEINSWSKKSLILDRWKK